MRKRKNDLDIPSFLNNKPKSTKRKDVEDVKEDKKKNTSIFKIVIICILVIVTFALILTSPLFNIYKINVSNNERYTSDEIKDIANIPFRYKYV